MTKPARKKSLQKHIPKRQARNEILRRKLTTNLQSGMGRSEAMLAAGYSPATVHASARRTLERPLVKSALTEAVERIMAARQKPFDDIVKPYVDGLDAPLVVKSQTEGIATIARDPDTQQILPDHDTRIKAADRLVGLLGGVPRDVEMPAAPAKGLTVIINRSGPVQINHTSEVVPVNRTTIEPTGEAKGDVMPKVQLRKK